MPLPPPRRLLAGPEAGLPVIRNVARAGLTHAFGPPTFDARQHPGDPGLVGPASASWRVIAEPAAIVGGVRALLVQLLHPLAMAGVHEHSRFRDDPLGRLRRTSAYVTATVFGSVPEAFAASRRVRQVHVPVRGSAPDGRPYRAGNPALLVWVSTALTASFLDTDRRFAPHPVRGADADAFVAEQARIAALLDPRVNLDELESDPQKVAALQSGELALPLIEEGWLPTTTAELAESHQRFAPDLAVGSQAREALRFLLWPNLPPAVRAGYLPILAGAIASLEPAQRRLLGLPGSRLTSWPVQVNTRALLTGFRLAIGTSPGREAARRRAAAPRSAVRTQAAMLGAEG